MVSGYHLLGLNTLPGGLRGGRGPLLHGRQGKGPRRKGREPHMLFKSMPLFLLPPTVKLLLPDKTLPSKDDIFDTEIAMNIWVCEGISYSKHNWKFTSCASSPCALCYPFFRSSFWGLVFFQAHFYVFEHFPAGIYVHHMYAILTEARRGRQSTCD